MGLRLYTKPLARGLSPTDYWSLKSWSPDFVRDILPPQEFCTFLIPLFA